MVLPYWLRITSTLTWRARVVLLVRKAWEVVGLPSSRRKAFRVQEGILTIVAI